MECNKNPDGIALLANMNTTTTRAPNVGQDQLVDAPTLLQVLWPEGSSRPSLRWLREQQRRRTIPYVKIGTRVWFRPNKVREHLDRVWTCRAVS